MSAITARTITVNVAGRQYTIPAEALIGISPSLARAYRVLPLGEHDGHFVVLTDDYTPDLTREFVEVVATQPLKIITVPSQVLDAAISSVFGDDDKPDRPLTSLAEVLIEGDALTPEQVAEAAIYAVETGTALGPAVIERGYITPWNLALLISRYLALPVINLRTCDIMGFPTDLLPQAFLRTQRIVPLSVTGTTATVAMVDPLDTALIRQIAEQTGRAIHTVLTTDRDIDWALRHIYRADNVLTSTQGLVLRQPQNSAHITFKRRQTIGFIGLGILFALGLIISWQWALIAVNVIITAIYVSFALYKTYLLARGFTVDLTIYAPPEDMRALRDEDLPSITVLIPLYREAAIVPVLLRAIANLDYPAIKLDVKILLEEEDEETAAAVRAARPPEHFKIVRVPDATPKTKPKACNYGLIEATGELLVIYDAEDIPDRDQLKKCVVAFRNAPDDVACIQAKLNYFNRSENLLTSWFTLEYSQWFDIFLPGLGATRAPIPLGGTSNFFITERLIRAGAWDPYNVTEDADLGIRLFKLHYRTAILDSTTYEEANTRYGNWIRQRSRWIKGYMQTWLVHNRNPFRLWRELGTRDFWSVQATVGGTFAVILINPILWLTTILWYGFHTSFVLSINPGLFHLINFVALIFGNAVFIGAGIVGAIKRAYYKLLPAALVMPLYWLMMSIAAYKALWQLVTKPFYWEKTSHGLSNTTPHPGLPFTDSEQ
ncbi:MAG: glycosyltransferase [Chloroflexota bacterium]|nr:glycosyltransferase [Chloroflexota bacterium]